MSVRSASAGFSSVPNDQHGKLLMMAPSYDRFRALGFRCVKGAE
jgi:hypothetical protein